jgi:Tfp pilus assembly PilM family ATPase
LAAALGTEVQIGDPWVNIDKKTIPTRLAEDRSIYTVATGLAMKNV